MGLDSTEVAFETNEEGLEIPEGANGTKDERFESTEVETGTKQEGESCGKCFNLRANFDCGKCVEGLKCIKDPNSDILPDLPSKCRKALGNSSSTLYLYRITKNNRTRKDV